MWSAQSGEHDPVCVDPRPGPLCSVRSYGSSSTSRGTRFSAFFSNQLASLRTSASSPFSVTMYTRAHPVGSSATIWRLLLYAFAGTYRTSAA